MRTHLGADATTDVQRALDLPVQGRFDLGQSIGFGFGQRAAGADDVMRLAFCLDSLDRQVGVAVRQPSAQRLTLDVVGDADVDLDAVRAQVARVLSVDVDGRGYDDLGRDQPLVAEVQAARPGLRPPLFYSAYEAALWAILSARQPSAQMAKAREQLSREHGRIFAVAGQAMAAAPLPARLAEVEAVPGVREAKLPRLRSLAVAAIEGELDTQTLHDLPVEQAETRLQQLPGIGPFYAELVAVRALGHTDVLAQNEPMVRECAAALVGASEALTPAELEQLAQPWRPWRTWVTVGIRATAAGRAGGGRPTR